MKSKDVSIVKWLFLGALCIFLVCLGFVVSSEAYYGSYGSYGSYGYGYPSYGGGYGAYPSYGGYGYGGYGLYGGGGGGAYGGSFTLTPGTFPGGLQGMTIPYISPFFQSMYPLTTTFGQGLSPSNYLGMSILSSRNSIAGLGGLSSGFYGGLYGGLYGGGLGLMGLFGGLW